MNIIEVNQNLQKIVERYQNVPLIETNSLSEILRDLGCNLSYLVQLRKEYYQKFQLEKSKSQESTESGKIRDAEYLVPELDEIRKILRHYSELQKDIRTQISLWKNND